MLRNMFPLPSRLRWARRAAQAQIVFSVALFTFAYLALVRDTPFFHGVGDALADSSGREVFTAETLSYLSGPLLLGIVISVVVMQAMRRRSRTWGMAAYTLLALQVCSAFAVGGVALFGLIMLLCLAQRDAAEYLSVLRSPGADTTTKQLQGERKTTCQKTGVFACA